MDTKELDGKVGELVMSLARKGLIVKVAQETSMLSRETIYLQVTMMNKGKSVSLKEALSPAIISDIQDPLIIADAIHERLRKMPTS